MAMKNARTEPTDGMPSPLDRRQGTRSGARRNHRGRLLLRLATSAALVLVVAAPSAHVGAATTQNDSPVLKAVVPGDDWLVEAPSAHGMDEATLGQAKAYAFADGRNTQGVVVVRGGVIVREWYAPGSGPTSWAASWSVAKSFTSALIGIAIGEGLIPSIDEPMTTYYPEWAGTPKAAITLRHVLHMESGLDWDEDYAPGALASSEIIAMVGTQNDQLSFAAGIPSAVAPGTRFNYSSGDSMLLSGVLKKATGRSTEAYAQEKLLDPIGINQLEWWRDANGNTLTYCCVDTTSRDFARFGLLYLRGGRWDTQQVVPASWASDSITDTATTYSGYGYQWWLDLGNNGTVPPYYSARGHDGQYIYVIPSLDLVVVRNGTYVKSPCPPVADPALLPYYPPSGLVPGQGTTPPSDWIEDDFLGPIVESITDGNAATSGPARGSDAGLDGGASSADESVGGPVSAKGSSGAVDAGAMVTAADPAPCLAAVPATTAPTTTNPIPVVTPAFTG